MWCVVSKRIALLGALLALSLAWGFASVAAADGGMIGPMGLFLYESAQRAVVIYSEEDGTEDLIVQAGFRGQADEFAWIIPVPSMPEVTTADAELFYEAAWMTRPEYLNRGDAVGCACNEGFQTQPDGSSGGDVTIYDELTVGVYAVRIVGADSTAALADSLEAWGYLHAENRDVVLETLGHYVDKDWVFVALRIQGDGFTPGHASDFYYGGTDPVHLRFEAAEPVYPMRISAMSADEASDVTLYVCARHRMTFPGAETLYANRIDSHERAQVQRAYETFAEVLPDDCFLTKLHVILSPEEMEEDIILTPASSDREMRQIYYSGWPPLDGVLMILLGAIFSIWRRRQTPPTGGYRPSCNTMASQAWLAPPTMAGPAGTRPCSRGEAGSE